MATILCIDDESNILKLERQVLQAAGHRAIAVTDAEAAAGVLRQEDVDLILSDLGLPGTSGLEFLRGLRSSGTRIPLVMLTGFGTVELAVEAMKAGAIDFVEKPISPAQLRAVVDRALKHDGTARQLLAGHGPSEVGCDSFGILGGSPALQEVLDRAELVAPTRVSVLLQGESGTGKELIARLIHRQSGREGPFSSINCAAMPEALVEAILFGHDRGAFTGAVRQVKGAFERADGGTLLLDEISELRLDLQAKLLRVLQEQEFERLGGVESIRVDVRVIATTGRDLLWEVEKGNFRKDLYYRLAVLPIHVPPLRERLQDVPLLAEHFAEKAAMQFGRAVPRVSSEAIAALLAHSWPGNVRELDHVIERAVLLSPGPEIGPEELGLPLQSGQASVPAGAPSGSDDKGRQPDFVQLEGFNVAAAEQVLIGRALAATGQNRTRAAQLLGISVRTLRNKLNRTKRADRTAAHGTGSAVPVLGVLSEA